MRTRVMVSVVCACAWFVACGGDDAPNGGANDSAEKASPNANGSGASTPNDSKAGGVSVAALDIVFNEVAAVGNSEWIEIANRGAEAANLGDYYVADSDKTTNEPKRSSAMRFPPGTTLGAGARFLIVASKKNGTVGPHPKADCLPEGPDSCYFATFGISATTGEALHFLAPDGSVVTSTAIPKSLSADAGGSTTQTMCRIPDLTGELTTCAPTPGQANQVP